MTMVNLKSTSFPGKVAGGKVRRNVCWSSSSCACCRQQVGFLPVDEKYNDDFVKMKKIIYPTGNYRNILISPFLKAF